MEKYRKSFGKGKSLEELTKENKVNIPKKVDEPISYAFEHFYNPLHFYSRMREMGISASYAKEITKKYEIEIYKLIIKEVKSVNNKEKLK